jgi:squalene-hopene/tetraprenyl-beta-curcumene cyclase
MIRTIVLSCLVLALGAGEGPPRAAVEALLAEAQAWSLSNQQPSGALVPGNAFCVGITALAAGALVSPPRGVPADHPVLAKALDYVLSFKQRDGGVYTLDEGLGVYSTSLAMLLAMRLPIEVRTRFDIPAMQRYLFAQQNPENGELGQGGIGYGDKGRGSEDLSNTGYALQALKASGIPADDPRMKAALAFVERCQDLSAVNKQPWVKNSGGGVYGPQEAARSWEKADESQSARWTPSGNMTYELISSYLTLDLSPDDQRVQAAVAWLRDNYGFDANPGMGAGKEAQGLFHSYALAGTTFGLLGLRTLSVKGDREVDWRSDLFAALTQRAQHVELSGGRKGAWWINSTARWAEGMPCLCTAYAVRALNSILAEAQAPGK